MLALTLLLGALVWLSGLSSSLQTQRAQVYSHSQGTFLGSKPGSQLGVGEGQQIYVSLTRCCFSPLRSPSLPLSLKVNK